MTIGSLTHEILHLKKIINKEEAKNSEFIYEMEKVKVKIEELIKTQFFTAFPFALSFLDFIYKPLHPLEATKWETEMYLKFYNGEFKQGTEEALEVHAIISQRANSLNIQNLTGRLTHLTI